MVVNINDVRKIASDKKKKKEEDINRRKEIFDEIENKTLEYYYDLYERKFNIILLNGEPVKKAIYAENIMTYIYNQYQFKCTNEEGFMILCKLSRKLCDAYRAGGYHVELISSKAFDQDIKGYSEFHITF